MHIQLSYSEIQIAHLVGSQRQIYNMKICTSHRHGLMGVEHAIAYDMIGCAGEMAVAKALNLYWDIGMSHSLVDVGGKVEVRTVTSENKRLIIHPDDKKDMPYVLVYSEPRTKNFWLKGWAFGRDGMKDEYWADPQKTNRYAYFVPDEKLSPISELKKFIND